MIIKNAKIFDGEKFIEEDTVVLEGKFIKKITNFSLIDEKGLEKMSKELSNILGYMEILNDIDTENIVANEIMSSNINSIREDKIEKFENAKGILENAKTIGDMINVPSINNNEEE